MFDDLIYGPPGISCGMSLCPPTTDAVSAKAKVFAADWVQSGQIGSFRPFVDLGAGLLLTTPTSGQDNTTSSSQPAFDYGVGIDLGLTWHIGLRLQYHGDLRRATGFIANDGSPGFVNTAGPALGVFYRF